MSTGVTFFLPFRVEQVGKPAVITFNEDEAKRIGHAAGLKPGQVQRFNVKIVGLGKKYNHGKIRGKVKVTDRDAALALLNSGFPFQFDPSAAVKAGLLNEAEAFGSQKIPEPEMPELCPDIYVMTKEEIMRYANSKGIYLDSRWTNGEMVHIIKSRLRTDAGEELNIKPAEPDPEPEIVDLSSLPDPYEDSPYSEDDPVETSEDDPVETKIKKKKKKHA